MDKKRISILFIISLSFFTIAQVLAQSGNSIVAKYGSTPTIDGLVGDAEWSDASTISFDGAQVFVKQDGSSIHVGFKTPILQEELVSILFDVENDKGSYLTSNDIGIFIWYNGTTFESHKDTSQNGWLLTSVSGWTAISQTTSTNCHAEFKISYSKLNITAGTDKALGINFGFGSAISSSSSELYFWSGSDGGSSHTGVNPSEWGTLNSSGYDWVPEFPSLFILSGLLIAVPLIAIAYRKRTTCQDRTNFPNA